eukprot:XP_011673875.1 PREDICTED: uncharacterized protein LOC105442915 isoform X1 [Strongylocentrotus purpuratus]
MTVLMGFNGAEGRMESCGDGNYDQHTQICCGGQVERQPSTAVGTRACCGGTVSGTHYFHGQQICCGNTLRNITPDLQCCNSQQFYNETTQTCCGAEVVDMSEGKVCCPGPNNRLQGFPGFGGDPKCCGISGPYYPERELCCEVGREQSIIRERPSGREMECCGLNSMDASTHMCCNKEQIQREPLLECCGSGTYNVTTEICCKGVAVPRGLNGGYECCGVQAYNPENEFCCFGAIRGLGQGKCCTGDNQKFLKYQPGKQSCCKPEVSSVPEISGIQQCCGKKAYLTSSKMCCKENLVDREEDLECCGSDTYNTRTHLCCHDSILLKRTTTDQCCASLRFDPTTHTCCGQQVVSSVGKCCLLTADTFGVYNERQTCCGVMDWNASTYTGHIYDVPTSPHLCCGAQLQGADQLCEKNVLIEKSNLNHDEVCWYYNGDDEMTYTTFNKEQTYCDIRDGVTAISPGHQLCGSGTYNPESQLCCDNHIHDNADKACCGFNAYDKSSQSCLLGNVFDDIPEIYAGKCRDKAFNNQTDTCDVNFEIRPISEVEEYPERCGTEPFNPVDHECCNRELIGPGFTCCGGIRAWDTPGTSLGEGKCCKSSDGSSKGYNDQTHICCQGEVHVKSGQAECCGSDAYDPADASSMCCGDRLYAVTGGKTECTGTSPHRSDQIVCDGVVHPASPDKVCCGKSLINLDNHVCCEHIPYIKESQDTQCCGKVSYDRSNKTCCGVSLYKSLATEQQCCGNMYYDISDEVCHQTGEDLYVFRSDDADMVCSEGTYNSTKHTCCQGILHKHIANGQCCGNSVVRNLDEEVCCGGEVKRREGRHTECCGGRMFNPNVYQCCGRRIMPIYSSYRQCCNNQIIRAIKECVGN